LRAEVKGRLVTRVEGQTSGSPQLVPDRGLDSERTLIGCFG